MNFNVGDALQAPPRLQRAFRGNWFYRVQGDSRERNPANNSSRIVTANEVEYKFPAVGPGVPVNGLIGEYGFILTDTGPNSSLVTTHLCFINNTQTTFTIDTFLAVDLDLLGTFGGDFSLPTQFNNGRLLTFKEAGDTGIIYGPGAIGSGIGLDSDILDPLANNNLVDNFPDFNFGATPNDLQGVVQFELVVPPGQEICVPAYIGISINNQEPIVPEPATISLLSLAGLALCRGRCFLNRSTTCAANLA